MGRLKWRTLTWVAWHARWAWMHLVSQADRTAWANIAAAMGASTLHVAAWGEQDPRYALPTWVPCRACGGTPCTWDPMTQASIDRRLDELAALTARRNEP